MFRAYDAGRERLVAVKLFKLDLPPERVHQLVAAFEHLIGADLTHPAMAVPLGTGIADVSAYLAQDYVAAESLDLAVREYGPAPPSDALRVAAQLAGALDFAAVVNVAHGALHPRDVLLSSDETRITGVGVAQALESVGVTAPVRRPYTAPERIAGGKWDRRADVFSLAALIHDLLWAHRIPGTGEHAAGSLTDLPGANLTALRTVFARALADDPADRYETALEFVDALKAGFPNVAIEQSPGRGRQPVVRSVASAASADVRQSKPESRLPNFDGEPRLPLDGPGPTEIEPVPVAVPVAAAESITPIHDEAEPTPFSDETLDLRKAEAERYETVETAPAVAPVEEVPKMHEPPVVEGPPISLMEESRSAVWPLVASLLIGLALGFAGGYGIGTRERPPNTAAVVPSPGTEVAVESTVPSQPPIAAPSTVEQPARSQSPKAEAPVTPPAAASKPRPSEPSAATTRQQTASSRTPAPKAPARSQPSSARSQTSNAKVQAARAPQEKPAATPSSTTGRYQGTLDVDSRPTGARVFLDGRLVGTTPLALPSVPAGEHVIRIERDGYRRWSSSVRVVAAEQNRVTASLER